MLDLHLCRVPKLVFPNPDWTQKGHVFHIDESP